LGDESSFGAVGRKYEYGRVRFEQRGPCGEKLDRVRRHLCRRGGNDNGDAAAKSPARIAEAITVERRIPMIFGLTFSNYGSVVDLFAPGVGVLSAWKDSDTSALYADGTRWLRPMWRAWPRCTSNGFQ